MDKILQSKGRQLQQTDINDDLSSAGLLNEVLMQEGMATGVCIYPDLQYATNENKDWLDVYNRFALIPDQTHSCNVAIAQPNQKIYKDTDALISFDPGVIIGVKTADCVPILIYASDIQCVGAIHAGWKGTLGGIVDKVIDILEERGVNLTQLKVAFGPSISKDIYEVDVKLAESFIEAGFTDYVYSPMVEKEKPHIDLQGVNMERFVRRGVKPENIMLHEGCSYNSKSESGTPLYASHRRSGGAAARMLTCIKLNDN